jgi:hypothetical protein
MNPPRLGAVLPLPRCAAPLPLLLLLACDSVGSKAGPPEESDADADTDTDTDTDADSDADSDADTDHQTIAIPSYFYPDLDDGGLWASLAEAHDDVSVAVINPNSGPGFTPDAAYQDLVPAIQAGGTQVLGYVSTRYGARDPLDVLDEVHLYYSWYGVDGIFLDEGPDTASCEGVRVQYDGYAAAIHAEGSLVALNPGTDTCESYLDFIDVLLLFEDDARGWDAAAQPAWMARYSPDRFWMLAYNQPDAEAAAALAEEAWSVGYGRVYITDDTLPNPWDTLPPYWDALLGALP